jgi:hypothetical protein
MKASGISGFATQLAVCVKWATDNIEPTLPQHVRDHWEQTECERGKCQQ